MAAERTGRMTWAIEPTDDGGPTRLTLTIAARPRLETEAQF